MDIAKLTAQIASDPANAAKSPGELESWRRKRVMAGSVPAD